MIGCLRLIGGRELPSTDEQGWEALQDALVPVMARHSAALWGG